MGEQIKTYHDVNLCRANPPKESKLLDRTPIGSMAAQLMPVVSHVTNVCPALADGQQRIVWIAFYLLGYGERHGYREARSREQVY